jgi:uncharacterized membrane protein
VNLTIFALLVTLTSGAQAQTETILPPLSGDNQSRAYWINDWGEVAGNSIVEPVGGGGGTRTTTAVVWDSEGTPMALPPLEGDTDSFAGSGNSINNHRHIAGTSFGSGGRRAVVWGHQGTIIRVLPPLPGDTGSVAFAISAHGRVVGRSLGSGETRTVVWDQQGRITDLGDGLSTGHSINPRTEVAGSAEGAGTAQALVWDRKGTARQLPGLPGGQSRAFSINVRGHVAGTSTDFFSEITTAVVWDSKGTIIRELPPLGGDTDSSALGINHRGVVVGTSEGGVLLGTAVIWDRDGTPTALPGATGGVRCEARGINKREVVVGFCNGPGDPSEILARVWR